MGIPLPSRRNPLMRWPDWGREGEKRTEKRREPSAPQLGRAHARLQTSKTINHACKMRVMRCRGCPAFPWLARVSGGRAGATATRPRILLNRVTVVALIVGI